MHLARLVEIVLVPAVLATLPLSPQARSQQENDVRLLLQRRWPLLSARQTKNLGYCYGTNSICKSQNDLYDECSGLLTSQGSDKYFQCMCLNGYVTTRQACDWCCIAWGLDTGGLSHERELEICAEQSVTVAPIPASVLARYSSVNATWTGGLPGQTSSVAPTTTTARLTTTTSTSETSTTARSTSSSSERTSTTSPSSTTSRTTTTYRFLDIAASLTPQRTSAVGATASSYYTGAVPKDDESGGSSGSSSSSSSFSSGSSRGGFSRGAKAGVGIGIVAVLGVLGAVISVVRKRKKNNSDAVPAQTQWSPEVSQPAKVTEVGEGMRHEAAGVEQRGELGGHGHQREPVKWDWSNRQTPSGRHELG